MYNDQYDNKDVEYSSDKASLEKGFGVDTTTMAAAAGMLASPHSLDSF